MERGRPRDVAERDRKMIAWPMTYTIGEMLAMVEEAAGLKDKATAIGILTDKLIAMSGESKNYRITHRKEDERVFIITAEAKEIEEECIEAGSIR